MTSCNSITPRVSLATISEIADPSGKCHSIVRRIWSDDEPDWHHEVQFSNACIGLNVIPDWIFLIWRDASLGPGLSARARTITKAGTGIEANANHSSRFRRRLMGLASNGQDMSNALAIKVRPTAFSAIELLPFALPFGAEPAV